MLFFFGDSFKQWFGLSGFTLFQKLDRLGVARIGRAFYDTRDGLSQRGFAAKGRRGRSLFIERYEDLIDLFVFFR